MKLTTNKQKNRYGHIIMKLTTNKQKIVMGTAVNGILQY